MTVCEWFRPSRFWSYFLVKTLFVFGIELIILFSFFVIVLSGSRSLNRRKAKIQKETKRGRECTTLLTFATFYCTFFVYCHRFSIKCSRIRSLNRRIAKLICRHSADHRHRSSLPIFFCCFIFHLVADFCLFWTKSLIFPDKDIISILPLLPNRFSFVVVAAAAARTKSFIQRFVFSNRE